ncbi:MAG: hypothetical protein P1U81_02705 [Verrucomicrobiales bacterium]|jgi:hypothetical protein|nr:hypothetical protein [Verrucomicrobiales bacterium]
MKSYQILLLCLVGLSSALTSCTTKNQDADPAVQGISASQSGSMTRENIYNWQDRTFRELAY